jgi:hypothetical protein
VGPTLLVAVFAVAVAALVVEGRVRDRDERAVAGCADEVTTAVALAGRRIDAMYSYVRPALDNGPSPALREGLYLLIAKSARGADHELVSARRTCSDVRVLPLHDALEARRDRCVEVLDAQRARLQDVAWNGAMLLRWMVAPRTC